GRRVAGVNCNRDNARTIYFRAIGRVSHRRAVPSTRSGCTAIRPAPRAATCPLQGPGRTGFGLIRLGGTEDYGSALLAHRLAVGIPVPDDVGGREDSADQYPLPRAKPDVPRP